MKRPYNIIYHIIQSEHDTFAKSSSPILHCPPFAQAAMAPLYERMSGVIPSTFMPASRSSERRQSPDFMQDAIAVLKLKESGWIAHVGTVDDGNGGERSIEQGITEPTSSTAFLPSSFLLLFLSLHWSLLDWCTVWPWHLTKKT